MWFIGVEVEQETCAPPPEKNPGSAPATTASSCLMLATALSSKRTRTQETTYFCIPSSIYFTLLLLLAFMDSSILNTNISYFSYLGKFLEPVVGYNSRWLLCWRATLHGWDVRKQFHRRCDGKRDTVTIIKKDKYVFGGYTDIPWGKKLLAQCPLKQVAAIKRKVEPD